jgi:hypothetical protein
MKIQCRTLFDCSRTGVTGSFRASEIPYQDRAGQTVNDHNDWHRSRNQQRNYETLLQIFGLRTQPQEISNPQCQDGVWEFSFISENEGVFEIPNNDNPLAGLLIDCESVPMIINLTEINSVNPVLTTAEPKQNIWFKTINTLTE